MTDDFLTSTWVDHRHRSSDQVATAIGAAFEVARVGLRRLNAYEFDAPWRRDADRRQTLNRSARHC